MSDERRLVAEALQALEVQNLVLGIQDPAFPGDPTEDLGRGSPYSPAARRMLRFAAELGFNGVQLGPQGLTSATNPSPYDGTVFSRNTLNLDPVALREAGLLSQETHESLVAQRPEGSLHRAAYPSAYRAAERMLDEAFARHLQTPVGSRLEQFRRDNHGWLIRDGLYQVLCAVHAQPFYRNWPGPLGTRDQELWNPGGDPSWATERVERLSHEHPAQLEQYALGQYLVHQQHQALREASAGLGMKLYGDMQIGFSAQDAWSYHALFLPGFFMGAPPSRTNPEGQPWNYPLLDPRLYRDRTGAPGPALAFIHQRVAKLFEEYDGLRIDHPHGLVCPWVYRAWHPDPLRAVQQGTRLFSSLTGELKEYAIPTPEQLNTTLPHHADDWVTELSSEQVDQYSIAFDAVVAAARAHGRERSDLVCEVLSTLPFPLAKVLERHGLGRFRILQKANLDQPMDVYRAENAQPADWIMLGNHDTPSAWGLLADWMTTTRLEKWAEHLSFRLASTPAEREALARKLKTRSGWVVQAMFAEALASKARNVMVFFTDLLGIADTYNVPGTISALNWSLRVPPEYARQYPLRRRELRALNLPLCLAMAIRARGAEFAQAHSALLAGLEQLAGVQNKSS